MKLKLKIGDNLLCIKDHLLVKKGKRYKLLNISKNFNDIIITSSIDSGIFENAKQTYWSLYKDGNHYLFSEFFISEREERLKKLKKLNYENRMSNK